MDILNQPKLSSQWVISRDDVTRPGFIAKQFKVSPRQTPVWANCYTKTKNHTPNKQNRKIILASKHQFPPLACSKLMGSQDNKANDKYQYIQLLDT